MALIILLIAGGVCAQPKIEIEEPRRDFGQVAQGATLDHVFTVRNAGDQPLVISLVRSSCPTCSGAMVKEKVIPPGGKGELNTTFYTKDVSGPQHRTLEVVSNDPVRPVVEIALVATVLAQGDGPRQVAEPDLVARMSLPWQDSLVRGNVPVFGVAYGRDFKLWRLEYGEGEAPKEWKTIAVSQKPVSHDPWAAGEVRWDPDTGTRGNLHTWETGLASYEYRSYPWTQNLNGLYTLRLVAEGKSGRTSEARVTVVVGEALVRALGGTATSPDNRVVLSALPQAITEDFLVVSILPSQQVKVGPNHVQIGSIYEFRPPRTKFMKPVTLTMAYTDDLLRRGEQRIPENKLGIYAYQPVDEYWKHVPCKLITEQKKLVAEITSVTRYVAYFGILADLKAADVPVLEELPRSVEVGTVEVTGTAEPDCKVEVLVGDRLASTTQADGEGKFRALRVALASGTNEVKARAVDAAGNAGLFSEPLRVSVEPHPPKQVKSVQILGPYQAMQDDQFLVKLVGEDAHPEANTCVAHVLSSVTDPKGIDLVLRETEPTSGVFVARFRVKRESSSERAEIGAGRDGEVITAFSVAEPDKRDTQPYKDMSPPTAPRIWSKTHPSHCQWTFENTAENPMGDWRTLDGEHGAAVTVVEDYQNSYLALSKQGNESHLGAVAIEEPVDLNQFRILAFDYSFDPWVKIDLLVNLKGAGWRTIKLTDDNAYHEPMGEAFGIVRDGRWRHAEVDLLGMARRAFPSRAEYVLEELQFVNWDKSGALKMSFGASGPRPMAYRIDNFSLLRYSAEPNVEFLWGAQDENGMAGYSFCLDNSPQTVPQETVMTTNTSKRYDGLADGRWYFHVRAQDKPGNWGPANHYLVVIDTAAPKVAAVKPSNETVPGDSASTVNFDDSKGTGIDPGSLRLQVDGQPFSMSNKGLSFDVETQTLTFRPREVSPQGLLFADGQTVALQLAATDYMGRAVTGTTKWAYKVTSPLKVRPGKADGKNGWYITGPEIRYETAPGEEVQYEWQTDFAQDEFARRGNSINTLFVNLKKHGKSDRLAKVFKLDTTVPKTTIRLEPAKPDRSEGSYSKPPTITLSHDDYALRVGGLMGTYFETGDFQQPILTRQDPPEVFTTAAGAQNLVPRARSARWTGKLHVPVSGGYEFTLANPGSDASAALVINNERSLEVTSASRLPQSAKVFLFAGFHDIQAMYSNPKGANWGMALRWKAPKERSAEIPADRLFAVIPLARIWFRWDSGSPQEYQGPFAASVGQHTLSFHSEDEAGHVGTEEKLQIVVAGGLKQGVPPAPMSER